MSTDFVDWVGNDTIDRYPLPYEGKLTKVLCISKEVFKKLKATLNKFRLRPKIASPKSKTPFRQKASKKEPLGDPRNDDLKPDGDKCIGSFEPSNIVNLNNSRSYREKNLKAWFKEQESYEDLRYLECYQIKI